MNLLVRTHPPRARNPARSCVHQLYVRPAEGRMGSFMRTGKVVSAQSSPDGRAESGTHEVKSVRSDVLECLLHNLCAAGVCNKDIRY